MTTNELAWLLDSSLEVPGARHAVLVSRDGLQMARTKDVGQDEADTAAAALSGMQSLSRAMAAFAGRGEGQWQQTLVEFTHGWVLLVDAGQGTVLGVAAAPNVDLQVLTFKVQQLVQKVGKALVAAPREGVGAS